MAKEWGPSWLGQHLTGSSDWRLRLEGMELVLTLDGRTHRANVEETATYRVQAGTFWTDITLKQFEGREVKADGLPNTQGAALSHAVEVALADKHLRDDIAFLESERRPIERWLTLMASEEERCAQQRRWFTHEEQAAVIAARPIIDVQGMRARLKKPGVQMRLGPTAREIERAMASWEGDHRQAWAALNTAHVERELVACKDLLDRVESKPLTPEQARAVVCFDNRVQVVASAGSGKTSTMVAKAAYAIHRGFVDPKRIVLLAFNKQAAEELKERAAKAFQRLGMAELTVEASTFHALGLRLIGKATREKPDIPEWATDAAGGVRKLTEIVDELKDRSSEFRSQWDLFRFVFGKDLPAFGAPESADVWDAQGKGALVTTRGERVKSQEEVMIANFLFLNGVDYQYEPPYQHRTADESHRQYRPDFYYPELDLYHEHFALNAQGLPPPDFEGYLEGVQWKRQLHKDMGTTLFETTSHGLRTKVDLPRLEAELTSRGVVMDPNPEREIPQGGQKPMDSMELIGLVRTFMSHAKSNCLTIPMLRQKLSSLPADAFKHRYEIFLDIAAPIMDAWDKALATEDGIDFEDMLNQAAEHLESGRVESPYDLVMADEFQDASRARARLCRALVQAPGRFLFAVGDDWQSINRFAGADVSVMTGFREFFGHGQVLKLEQTFRCPQALCDVSSAFVSKNPAQIAKRVHSTTPPQGPVLQAFQVDSKEKLADAIDRFVVNLGEQVRDGTIPPGRNGKVSVYVLGRYNADRQYVPTNPHRFNRWVDVSFLTIHRSKGSEADYVILPEMLTVLKGRSFPNTRTDDPVLALAMPQGDTFSLGEERRLFYVALTRARRSLAMFTARGQCSTFLRELEQDGAVVVTDTDGKTVREETCPACKQGVLVLRTGPYGEFRSCSNFPSCSYKPKRRGVEPSPLAPPRPATRSQPVPRPAPRVATPTRTPPVLEEPKKGPLSFLYKVNQAVGEMSHSLERSVALQSATAELSRHLQAERRAIETALKSSQHALDLESQLTTRGPEFRARFEQSYAELLRIQASGPKASEAAIERHPLPDFKRVGSHDHPEIQQAISAKVDGLREDRNAFLSTAHGQLARNPALLASFTATLRQINGEHYWAALDPTGTLKRGT
ncbi:MULTISPECIES: UvrD-helicase domain-containing protein [unclassified Pseudoxanthomonas]|uniref:UvrD-helicase domain-containing protein n=1 Tax=unclassified Pseudoxanthomonas TaxID=2645906 RepID=UPI003F4F4606